MARVIHLKDTAESPYWYGESHYDRLIGRPTLTIRLSKHKKLLTRRHEWRVPYACFSSVYSDGNRGMEHTFGVHGVFRSEKEALAGCVKKASSIWGTKGFSEIDSFTLMGTEEEDTAYPFMDVIEEVEKATVESEYLWSM